ncbi:hypothetical protein KIL84_001217 [Mauremys mutica]|uniref:Uncharacterized protein n=1 Tax=Mauremys mutica TaxID=74926 RepID=A0A9D4AP30_9SAUR|nr:hypothetical protein KIL84_001217 [Mauremys mutica]
MKRFSTIKAGVRLLPVSSLGLYSPTTATFIVHVIRIFPSALLIAQVQNARSVHSNPLNFRQQQQSSCTKTFWCQEILILPYISETRSAEKNNSDLKSGKAK